MAKKYVVPEDFDRRPDSSYMTVPEGAAILGVSTQTIYRWISDGKLPKPKNLGVNTRRMIVGEFRTAVAKLGAGA